MHGHPHWNRVIWLNGVLGLSRDQFDWRAAERAGGVRVKPHVNATNVEAVITSRQDPARFVFLKFGQAHGAVHSVGVGLGGINKHGQRFQDGRVEATRGGGGGVRGVHVEDELGAAVAVAADLASTRLNEVPARVEVQADH